MADELVQIERCGISCVCVCVCAGRVVNGTADDWARHVDTLNDCSDVSHLFQFEGTQRGRGVGKYRLTDDSDRRERMMGGIIGTRFNEQM